MSQSSKSRAELEGELQEQIKSSSTKLLDALSELTYVVQPKTQVGFAADNLKYEAKNVQYKVMTTVDEAREGDPAARNQLITVVGISAGTLAVLIGLKLLQRARRKR